MRGVAGQEEAFAFVRSAVGAVNVPSVQALAKAFGLAPADKSAKPFEFATESIKELGDLDGDGIPEVLLKWTHPQGAGGKYPGQEEAVPTWALFLLAWDGAHWNASHLMDGSETFTVLTASGAVAQRIAVVVHEGATGVPYPVIFQLKDHTASLAWDSRAEESRYQGYDQGQVEFREVNGDGIAEIIASGRADPGLLRFPRRAKRGFEARTVYVWDGKAYAPGKTEYSANEDYTLYRFISALHLHDFRAAYALVDPSTFLRTDKPSLEVFRQRVRDLWPEFLDDQIFEVRETGPTAPESYAFELNLKDKNYVYQPTFSADSKHLLTGLERREAK